MSDPAARGIYRRRDSRFYWLAFTRNGKRYFASLETCDFAEAVKRSHEIRAAPALAASSGFKEEIEQFLSYKLRLHRFTASTASGHGYVLRAFARDIGKVSAVFVTQADVQNWYDHKLRKYSAVTANSYAMILRSFFNYCVEQARIIRQNPCQHLETAQELGTRLRDFCTEEQRDRLIATCERQDILFVLYCGFHAGLRKNEIIEARPFWFDLDAGLLHLRKTATINFKDREERTVPLTKAFKEFLVTYGLKEPFMLQPLVRHGVNRYRYDFTRPFNEHVCACDLGWVTPHTMRHTFASLLASAGVSLFKISIWLGDGPMVVERRYARLKPRDSDIEASHHGSSPFLSREMH